MKGSTCKCHLLVSRFDKTQIQESQYIIRNTLCEKLLGVKFDNKKKRIVKCTCKSNTLTSTLKKIGFSNNC